MFVMCRNLQAAKREGMATDAAGERELLIKAVRVNTLSKLTYSDTRQFLALIGDVFPGAESSDIPGVRNRLDRHSVKINIFSFRISEKGAATYYGGTH